MIRTPRQEGLGEWVRSHWGILSDSREQHLRSWESGAGPQGGHPQCPGGREGSHGCGTGPTCCVCFHSAEAVVATSLVVASRPCYIMSSAPTVAPATRVPFSPPLNSSYLSGVCCPAQDQEEGRDGGGGCCSGLTGSGEGGPLSSGVPRWGATCKTHTWSTDVRPAEGPAPAPPC